MPDLEELEFAQLGFRRTKRESFSVLLPSRTAIIMLPTAFLERR